MDADLTYAEAAKALRISRPSLERLVRARRIGFYRHGSRVTFSAEHLAAYRASREVKPLATQIRKSA